MRVIFLDIDGVLNSRRTMLAWGGGFIRDERPITREHLALDPVAVELLRLLTVTVDAKIVISSTWRMGNPIEAFHESFKLFDWDTTDIIIDRTPRTAKGFRGIEIDMWLADHPEVTDFLIIDDDSDMTDAQKAGGHFIHTSFDAGLGAHHVEAALRRFSVPLTHLLDIRREGL